MSVLELLSPSGKTGWPWTEESLLNSDSFSNGTWPRITIVTPSFNQGEFLEETIRSVLLQNYPNLEYIVIDAGSTDGSVDIIRKYSRHLAYWVSEKDHGQANALNKGFRRATGEWVAWINSDDSYLPGALGCLMRAANDNPRVQWIAGSVKFVHTGGRYLDSIRTQCKDSKLIDWLLARSHFHQPGAMWKRALFEEYGFLKESMHYAFDWEFWCRLVSRGVTPEIIEDIVATFRLHDASKTCTGWDRFCAENENIVETYMADFSGSERQALEERRTSLVCTRLKHESYRLLPTRQWRELYRHICQAAARRPQILLKKTPYLLLFKAGVISSMKDLLARRTTK